MEMDMQTQLELINIWLPRINSNVSQTSNVLSIMLWVLSVLLGLHILVFLNNLKRGIRYAKDKPQELVSFLVNVNKDEVASAIVENEMQYKRQIEYIDIPSGIIITHERATLNNCRAVYYLIYLSETDTGGTKVELGVAAPFAKAIEKRQGIYIERFVNRVKAAIFVKAKSSSGIDWQQIESAVKPTRVKNAH